MKIIAYIAAALTTIAFLPQVIRVYKTKSTEDISLLMFCLFTTGIFLWLLYGIFLKDFPIIIANTITLLLSAYILYNKIKAYIYSKKPLGK